MVKRIAVGLILFLALSTVSAYSWQINNFDVDIEIESDATFTVTEKILTDFSEQPKHGIIRNIPIVYRDEKGNRLNVQFQVLGITDENGKTWQYSQYPSGIYKVLKIGSPYVTYSTPQTYVIKYKVSGAILFLEDHDELYWNATGTEWDAAINNVTVRVSLPQAVASDALRFTSYTGKYGSRENKAHAQAKDGQSVIFTASNLSAYEGLTVVVGWPKGIMSVAMKSGYTSGEVAGSQETTSSSYAYTPYTPTGYRYFSFLFWLVLLLVPPAIVFFVMYSIWKKYGKDPALHKSIVVEYKAPEAVSPIEMGTLIDDKVDMRDLSATIIDLAVRGYIKIIETPGLFFQKKYSLVKLKDFEKDPDLHGFERLILRDILGGYSVGEERPLESLNNSFYQKLPQIKEDICQELIRKRYYSLDPEKAAKKYRSIAFVVLTVAFFVFIFPALGISLLLCAGIIFGFAKYMPAKTQKGMDVYAKILGFEEFLSRTEKDKIQMMERQNIFEKMLPYAICLGITGVWAKIFADIYTQAPAWFAGDFSAGFSMAHFIYSLNNSISSMNQTFVSSPRSVSSGGGFGGGGSSGGGFGGGGGSSW